MTYEKVLPEGIEVMSWSKDGTAVSCRIAGWIAGTVTVAAMIAGCGSPVASSLPLSASPGPGRQSPSRSPARTATLSPTAPPSPSPSAWSAPVCKAEDLKLSTRYGGVGAGNAFTIFVVTNDGSAPCVLGGSSPLLKEMTMNGNEQPVLKEGRRSGAAVVIKSGQEASFYADFGSVCFNPAFGAEGSKPHQLEITFTGASGPELRLRERGAASCSQQPVAVSPVQNGIVSTGYTQPLPTPSP